MKELRLKLNRDITKLSSADRRRALKMALDDELRKLQAKEKAYAKLKTVYRSVAKSTGIEIANTTDLVRLLLPYTSPAFKARIGYRTTEEEDSNGSPSVKGSAKKKRTRRSNNVKKADLTEEEIEVIKKAETLGAVNPLPPGTKNSGKNLPFPTFCGIKGINMRQR